LVKKFFLTVGEKIRVEDEFGKNREP